MQKLTQSLSFQQHSTIKTISISLIHQFMEYYTKHSNKILQQLQTVIQISVTHLPLTSSPPLPLTVSEVWSQSDLSQTK